MYLAARFSYSDGPSVGAFLGKHPPMDNAVIIFIGNFQFRPDPVWGNRGCRDFVAIFVEVRVCCCWCGGIICILV